MGNYIHTTLRLMGIDIIHYKDRLLRFGFELIEYIANLYNCEIEIIDNTENQNNKNWLKI